MALKLIGEAWRNSRTVFPPDRRVYFNFRKQEYPVVAGAPTFTKTDNDPSLVARWRLDEGQGAIGYDDSGNGANLTLAGGATWATGYRGKCLDFDGSTGYASGAVGAVGNAWSVSFWMYVDTLPAPSGYKKPVSGAAQFYFGLNCTAEGTQRIFFDWRNSVGAEVSLYLSITLTTAAWYYVTVTHTGTTTLIYLNGSVVATGSISDSRAEGAQTYYLGAGVGPGSYFDGKIDEVRLYSRALSQADVTQLYETNAINTPGSHYLSGGYGKWLMPLTSYVVVDVLAKPTFAYDTATYYAIWGWEVGAGISRLDLYYDPSIDKIRMIWEQPNTRSLLSAAYTSNATLQTWQRFTVVLNLSTGTTTGCALYVNGTLADDILDGNGDVFGTNSPLFFLGIPPSFSSYGFNIAYARVWLLNAAADLPTAADVANNFKDYKQEEIYFPLNGHATGHTRVPVTHKVRSISLRKQRYGINQTAPNPVSLALTLNNEDGAFADDQFATYSAATEYYNGQASQAFLQYPCPVECEWWYNATGSQVFVETEFVGRSEEGAFARRTGGGDISTVQIEANDISNEMAKRRRSKSYSYADKQLVEASVSSSLLHLTCGLGTNREWYDFCANNGFENAAISATWWTAAGVQKSRQAGGVLGSYEGQFYNSNIFVVGQTIQFTADKRIETGQKWTGSIYLKGTVAFSGTIALYSQASGGATIEAASVAISVGAATNYQRYVVTLPITSSVASVDKLYFFVTHKASGTMQTDCAQLIQNDQPLNWWLANTGSGVAGVVQADDAMAAEYEIMGVDADTVIVSVPWALINEGNPIWGEISDIGHAAMARTCGVSPCGTMTLRSPLMAGSSDPSPLFTVSDTVNLESIIDVAQANKLIVRGVYIQTSPVVAAVWRGVECGAFTGAAAGVFDETVAASSYWPNQSEFPDFYAKYEAMK